MNDPTATSTARFESEVVQRPAHAQYTATEDAQFERRREIYEKDKKQRDAARGFVEAVVWVVAAGAALYYYDMINVALYDPRVIHSWFWFGTACLAVFAGLGAYSTFVFPRVSEGQELEETNIIPIATLCLVVGLLCCVVSVWPVWGWMTPILSIVVFMGSVMLLSFLP